MNEHRPIDTSLGILLDRARIRDVIELVARGVSRADGELIKSGYHDPSWEEHGAFRGSGQEWGDLPWRQTDDRKMMHIGLLQSTIDIDGDVAHVETYFISHARTSAPISPVVTTPDRAVGGESEVASTMVGRYLDRFERVDGKWGIRVRRVVMDTVLVETATKDNALIEQFIQGDRYPLDPLYDRDSLKPRGVVGP